MSGPSSIKRSGVPAGLVPRTVEHNDFIAAAMA
jgi:hypothetical protein